MKLWLIRRPNVYKPFDTDEGYVVRAPDETAARALVGDDKDNNRYSITELSSNGSPGVILKHVENL